MWLLVPDLKFSEHKRSQFCCLTHTACGTLPLQPRKLKRDSQLIALTVDPSVTLGSSQGIAWKVTEADRHHTAALFWMLVDVA